MARTVLVFNDLDLKALGAGLKALREHRGLRPAQVAWRADLTPYQYGRIEAGEVNTRVETFFKICQVLEGDAQALLGLPPATA